MVPIDTVQNEPHAANFLRRISVIFARSGEVHRVASRGNTTEERVDYPLPAASAERFNYPSSEGLVHEVHSAEPFTSSRTELGSNNFKTCLVWTFQSTYP